MHVTTFQLRQPHPPQGLKVMVWGHVRQLGSSRSAVHFSVVASLFLLPEQNEHGLLNEAVSPASASPS